jgi:glycosyltransferase involved in cell wall biosynthesis
MRIILATVQVPFIRGGAEILAENLQANLRARGHLVDIVKIPFKWYPGETLLESMVAGRMLDLKEVNGEKVDLLIGLKFPAYYAAHPNKIVWLIHQHRQAYDLWQTEFGDIHNWPDAEWVRQSISSADTRYLAEAPKRYTISQNVSDRLYKYNGLLSQPLYHPPSSHEKMGCRGWEPYIFYPSRLDRMKRQHLLIESARYLRSETTVVIAGGGADKDVRELQDLARQHEVESRVRFEGYASEETKIDLLSRCNAVFFGAYDEDYGYVTLEGMFSGKPVLALSDSGGALEFVHDGYNGYVIDPDPRLLAARIDQLAGDADLRKRLGRNASETMREKRVSWDHVINTLLGSEDA